MRDLLEVGVRLGVSNGFLHCMPKLGRYCSIVAQKFALTSGFLAIPFLHGVVVDEVMVIDGLMVFKGLFVLRGPNEICVVYVAPSGCIIHKTLVFLRVPLSATSRSSSYTCLVVLFSLPASSGVDGWIRSANGNHYCYDISTFCYVG